MCLPSTGEQPRHGTRLWQGRLQPAIAFFRRPGEPRHNENAELSGSLPICAGTAGLLSGAAAMSFRKRSRPHRAAGNVFFISMLGMSGAGAYLAFMKPQMNNVFPVVLTFYLVAT